MWHTLKYTSGLNKKLVYVSEPIPEVHDYDVEVHIQTQQSKSETEQDPLDFAIRNSPALIKEPLAPTTPTTQNSFFAIAKSDLSQSIVGTTMTTTTMQTVIQVAQTAAIAPQHPLTEAELEELLNVAMGERGGGTEDPLRDPQVEEDHQEEEHLQLEEEQRHNQSQQQQMSKPWAKTPLSSKGKEAKWTLS